MRGKIIEKLRNDRDEMRLYQQEWLILEVTEHIAKVMEEKGIKKKDLAERLGRSKGYITQLLDGRANMTLRTVSDVMWALDCSLTVDVRPLGFETTLEPVGEYELPSKSDLWVHIRLLQIQQPDVTKKEGEKDNQLKLAG